MRQFWKEKKDQKEIVSINKLCVLMSFVIMVAEILCCCTFNDSGFDIKCVYLDVGQGDSSLIMTGEGYTVMIDTGTPGKTDKVISSLRSYGINKIDLLILTHFHEDHVAGTVDVLEGFEVKDLWCLDSTDNYIIQGIENAAKENKTEVTHANEGDKVTLGESILLEIKILCAYAEGSIEDENENSLIVLASYMDFSALYMADAGYKTEEYLLKNYGKEINCDILKVGHHGSDSSSTEEFINASAPQIAVISCEKNNVYGHPHSKVLDGLREYCEHIAYTYNGNFEVLVTGSQMTFKKTDWS